ncbi:hypothetical protein AB5I41_26705 [Sphingomonas sp. MMS24-JH45]
MSRFRRTAAAIAAAVFASAAAAQASVPAQPPIYGTWLNPHGSVAVRTAAWRAAVRLDRLGRCRRAGRCPRRRRREAGRHSDPGELPAGRCRQLVRHRVPATRASASIPRSSRST